MPTIITVHSYREEIDKTALVANMATVLALDGYRVGILDANVRTPGVHVLFGLEARSIDQALVNYLWAQCPIEAATVALHERDDAERSFLKQTKLWLVPGSKLGDSVRIARDGYDVDLLLEGLRGLVNHLALDYLVVDTQAGLQETMLLLLPASDTLVLVLRLDRQDYRGMGMLVEVARKLGVPRMRLVLSNVTSRHDAAEVRQRMSTTYAVPVAGVLPFSEEVAWQGSANIFAALHPKHPWAKAIREITTNVTGATE